MQTHNRPSDTAGRPAHFHLATLVALFLTAGVTNALAQSETRSAGTRAAVTFGAATELPSEMAPDAGEPDHDTGAWRDLNAGIDVLSTSAYVWRGFVPGAAHSVQTNGWVKVNNLTISSWMNLESDRMKVTEHDLTFDYTATRGSVTWSAGYINYVFPGASDRVSHELYAGAAHDSFFSPTLRIYQDLGAGSGTYISASAGHSFVLPWRDMVIVPSIALGYNHHQWIDASTFSDMTVSVKAAWASPIARVTISPSVSYSKSLASGLFTSRLFWGLGLSVD